MNESVDGQAHWIHLGENVMDALLVILRVHVTVDIRKSKKK